MRALPWLHGAPVNAFVQACGIFTCRPPGTDALNGGSSFHPINVRCRTQTGPEAAPLSCDQPFSFTLTGRSATQGRSGMKATSSSIPDTDPSHVTNVSRYTPDSGKGRSDIRGARSRGDYFFDKQQEGWILARSYPRRIGKPYVRSADKVAWNSKS